jgi:ketosteroid isomerase-like protein
MAQRDPQEFSDDDFDMDEQAAPPERGPGESAEIDRVLAANQAFFEAWSSRDAEAMDGLWSRHQPVSCIHPSWQPLTNRDQVMDSWRAIMRNPNQPRMIGGQATVRAILGDVAYVLYRQMVGGTPLIVTNVFVLEDAEWRVLVHHASRVSLRR